MYAKIEITGVIEVVTGMHIGGTSEFSAIGAIDSPVVRDALTQLPMIPGSSLKGKMRSLLSRSKSDNYMPIEIKDEPESVMRLFGFSGDTNFKRGRLQFSDMFLSNRDQLFARGARNETEVKLFVGRYGTISESTSINATEEQTKSLPMPLTTKKEESVKKKITIKVLIERENGLSGT